MSEKKPKQGELIAGSLKPFIGGTIQPKDLSATLEDIGKSIDSTYQPLVDWVFNGRFKYKGFLYLSGVNEDSAMSVLKELYIKE